MIFISLKCWFMFLKKITNNVLYTLVLTRIFSRDALVLEVKQKYFFCRLLSCLWDSQTLSSCAFSLSISSSLGTSLYVLCWWPLLLAWPLRPLEAPLPLPLYIITLWSCQGHISDTTISNFCALLFLTVFAAFALSSHLT